MTFWTRDGSVQVGPYKYAFGSLNFEFEVSFSDDETLMTANLVIYNLSPKTRNTIEEKKNLPIIINAGYEKDIGTIFVGVISSAKSEQKNLDWETKILATEAMDEWLKKEVNKTYKAGITAKEILEDLLQIFGIEVTKLELARNITYKRGKVCNGFLRNVLKEIVTSDCKSIFQVKNSQIFIKNPAIAEPYGILLTPGTGLLATRQSKTSSDIKSAQDTQLTKEDKVEEAPTSVTRQSLLNYRIGPGDTVRVLSKELNGDFKVKKGKFKGSRDKDWLIKMELWPI